MRHDERKGSVAATATLEGEELLSRLVGQAAADRPESPQGLVIGRLLAMTEGGTVPLLSFPGQAGTAALRGQSVVDLHSAHIGRSVVLLFESGDRTKPIVMGVLRGDSPPVEAPTGTMTLDADGERLVVTAREQLVLRCGKASITLTKAGKVLIDGAHVSSRSSGVHRIKGGSIQLN